MFRVNLSRFAAATPAAVAAGKPSKMQSLHKILTGEVQFKGKALLKECNVAAVFGNNWQTELADYSKSLPKEEQAVLNRQIARLNVTRYTTRELADFAGNGAQNIDAAAKAYNVSKGAEMLAREGEAKFVEYVNAEAKNANWSADAVSKYVAEVKAAKK